MSQKNTMIVLGVGTVGFILLLLFYQYALEEGLRIKPLIKLNKELSESYNVDVTAVKWEPADASRSSGEDPPPKKWVLIQFRPPSDTKNRKELARKILRRAENQYEGDRDPIIGFRVQCLAPDTEEETEENVEFSIEKELGPPEQQSNGNGSSGSG